MPITREFLGLDRPPLRSAAEYLVKRYQDGQSVDLSSAIVVLPGGQAGRRLLEILVEQTEQSSLILTPPAIETVGRLPEKLYRPKRPFASDLVQQLAWADVLRGADPDELGHVLTAPPERGELTQWLELGRVLCRLHTELAADGLDFADVVDRAKTIEAIGERERWEALRSTQETYLERLDGLELWDIQTARLVAVDQRECRTDKDIIVVGAVDMTITLRRMLDQVADRVTALVLAPDEWADRFDEHGCLTPESWQTTDIEMDSNRVYVVDGPAEEADRVVRCLAEYEGKYRADEITIGLADERIAPFIERQLTQCGIASRSAAGIPMAQTGPYRLLAAVESYLRSDRYPEFAALVRHPDVYEWIGRHEIDDGWLERLDEYFSEHLQSRLSERCPGTVRETKPVVKVYKLILGLLEALHGTPRPLAQWGDPLRIFLLEIYGHRDWDRDDEHDRLALKTFEEINSVVSKYSATIPPPLMPETTAAEALRLVLDGFATATIPASSDPEAIELLGWLELPWDDAPALVVCSFNEGYVPSSTGSDMFLPNSLRARLGLQDNLRRYARDAYALSVLLATRAELDLIVARQNADGDPLTPSRLLFAIDAERVAERALELFKPPRPPHEMAPLAGRLAATRDESDFPVPQPMPLPEPITELPVTAFRDYLACPYRFYLRRVLRLRVVDDSAAELDGAQFGSLLHEVLHEFGAGPCRDSTDGEEIRAFLNETLTKRVAAVYGRNALASVNVQIEQLRVRLNAFAEKQAGWAAAGWRIEHTELPGPNHEDAKFEVDGEPFVLRGRIDRVDVHRETGERIIFDYKSSDSGNPPEKVHQQRGEWVDLQLPLYRHLAASLDIAGAVKLGYILLPKNITKIEFRVADWSEDDLAEADEVAREVIRGIRQQIFWPPTDPPPDFSEEFAPICQDGVFEKTAVLGLGRPFPEH